MMKKTVLLILLALIFELAPSCFAITTKDYTDVVKITKKMKRLADRKKIEELSKYYSEDYKSFDGHNKKELLEIFNTVNNLYPDSKTKETVKKIVSKDDTIKVLMNEKTTSKFSIDGFEAQYALNGKIKGVMESDSDFSLVFKKEGENWKVIGDEIYNEETKINYGEAIDTRFDMEIPEFIEPGEEFCIKTTLEIPFDRFVMGSIGHDKIVYPPKKGVDPFRAVDKRGILERIMIANKEGLNEYANSTFVLISPYSTNKKDPKALERPAIAGMGLYVKRMNTKANDVDIDSL